jgi:hypothetical protein
VEVAKFAPAMEAEKGCQARGEFLASSPQLVKPEPQSTEPGADCVASDRIANETIIINSK